MKIINHDSLYIQDGIAHLVSNVAIQSLLAKNDLTEFDFDMCDPISLEFLKDTVIAIDSSVAIDKDGNSYPIYVVGNHSENLTRFLKSNEKTFQEFAKEHKCYKPNLTINDDALHHIIHDYTCYLVGKTMRYNPSLDEALGIKE